MAVLEEEGLLLDSYTRCSSGHELVTLVRMAVFASINISLNDYCLMKNDLLAGKNKKITNSLLNDKIILYKSALIF